MWAADTITMIHWSAVFSLLLFQAPGAGAGSGGRFGSGATKRGRGAAAGDADAGGSEAGQQKPEVEIVPDSWIWNLGCDGAEEGGSAEAGQALKQLPIHMVREPRLPRAL
jgi:hypothetical protein